MVIRFFFWTKTNIRYLQNKVKREGRKMHINFILIHLNLVLCLVLTLQDEISLIQPVTIGPSTIGF